MSSFDIKQLSEQDAFRLEQAQKEEANSIPTDDPGNVAPSFGQQGSPVARVVEQIMSHWADTDESWVQDLAEQSGDLNLKRIVGEARLADVRPQDGMTGDFKADAEGPTEGIEVPPRADGGEFGGGGGGGGDGGAGDLGLPTWLGQNDGGMADPGDMPDAGGELPGFSMEAEGEAVHGGGGGGGDGDGEAEDDDPVSPPKPPDPKKPKKP